MPREVTDTEGITWICAQAYAGLSEGTEDQTAGKVKGQDDTYWVVCTPSGGAQSVRLKLQGDWENSYSDEELIKEIATQQQKE